MTITNISNSFFQFCADPAVSCNDYYTGSLPIFNANDISLQFLVQDTNPTEVGYIKIWLLNKDLAVGAPVNVGTDVIAEAGGAINSVLLDSGAYLITTTLPCTAVPLSGVTNHPAVGDCIFLVIGLLATSPPSTEVVCKANIRLEYINDTCYTNVLRYKCDDDAYGFQYSLAPAAFYNQVRIPLTIEAPVPKKTKTGFRLSNGVYKTLSAVFQKQWSCSVNDLDDFMHTRISIALEHDYLLIAEDFEDDCEEFTSYYHEPDDDYDINWDETTKPGMHKGVAQAAFKLLEDPFYNQNSNC